MAKRSVIVFICFLFVAVSGYSPGYSRPKPRPQVSRPNERSPWEPQQVHISLSAKDYMRVSWITWDKNAESVIEYGKFPGKYNASARGNSSSYRYILYWSGAIHNVRIGRLEASTTYYYRLGGAGPEFSFRTPPSAFPVEFAVVGDLGQTEWTDSTLSHVGAKDYDVLILPGDLSYADMKQRLWDSFGRLVEPYASSRPWMVTEGNHEIEYFPILSGGVFKAYNARWLMPFRESQSNSNLYYSFNVAGAHIVMLGSYADYKLGSDQHKWLQNDLAMVNRANTPWIFAVIHAPWYNSNEAHKEEAEGMRQAMEKILYDARVDVVFAGHVHAYERFTRVYENKANPCGPVHITIGDGGNKEGLASSFEEPGPSISVFREASFGHGRLRVLNSTHMHWSWHRNDDSNAVVADEVWLRSLSSSCPSRVTNEAVHD